MNDVLNPEIVEDEESSLRPGDFDEYIGQTNLKENLKVFLHIHSYQGTHPLIF